MNLLLPPLMASVLVAGYVATASYDRTDGDERRYAADNMVRYHTLAVEQYRATPVAVLNPEMAPFAKVLDWQSREAFDNNGQAWVITYIPITQPALPSTISSIAMSSIPHELARKDFSGGTYGIWDDSTPTPTLASTIGTISITTVLTPAVLDGTPVIATRL
ncbi:MAG: hypothetical protein LW715_08400 [Rhodobacter sp.]|jgi:hypothetical protein|nr:hypothetical protein [Rhodobacter sp.]MCE2748779.1 hypothetical protein [Rhodobacter sp.]